MRESHDVWCEVPAVNRTLRLNYHSTDCLVLRQRVVPWTGTNDTPRENVREERAGTAQGRVGKRASVWWEVVCLRL